MCHDETQLKEKFGCGQRMIILNIFQRQRVVALWTLWKSTCGIYLALTPEEHVAAKTQYPDKEGYGTGKKFMMQVNNTLDIAESKYGHDKLIIVYVLTRAVATKSLTRKYSFLDNVLVKDCSPCRVHDDNMGRKASTYGPS